MFFGYVLGTKLDAVSLLRMRHKAMQLVRGRLAGNKSEKSQFYQSFNERFQFYFNFIVGFRSDVRPFLVLLWLRFGHEIRCYFAVADASQNHAACAWQARWKQK